MGRKRHLAAATAVLLTIIAPACRDRDRAASREQAEASDSSVRDAALAAARVWRRPAVPPGSADFSVNTPAPDSFDPGADVDCTFVVEPIGGSTPKFMCALADGEHVKVKYGAPNGELPSEVAATRLLAALGFFTDRMNRVHSVRCHGCPTLPQQALQCIEKNEPAAVCLQGATGTSVEVFSPGVIERPLAGKKIGHEGWSWYELDKIDPRAGGSSRAEIDALRLMAVLLAHWDNKGRNQKLLCPPGSDRPDGRCAAPIAAITDLGSSFGPQKVDLANWRSFPVWTDAASCRVSMKTLPFAGATFPDTQITEPGRQLALSLLRPLKPAQLDTLFEASGFSEFPHVLAEARQAHSWTAAFLDKVDQIDRGGPCPSS